MISPHLKALRPFLRKGDFEPGAWGHALVEELGPADLSVEKVAYSAFYMTRLEWLLRKAGIEKLYVAGIVTNGGVSSTVRDAHVRDFDIVLLSDGCAAFSRDVHETSVAALKSTAEVTTIADAMTPLGRS
jgi:nicotinamidase-related amidase